MTFLDRTDAGRQLANHLTRRELRAPVVLGLPCWGVVVAYEIARALGAPLDVVVARHIRSNQIPRLAVGAVAEGGHVILDEARVAAAKLPKTTLDSIVAKERRDVERWAARFRGCLPFPPVDGRHVVVVDDGAAIGQRAAAAVRAVRGHAPARVLVAVPVVSQVALQTLRREADEVVFLDAPPRFVAVNYWYARCGRTSDEKVEELLRAARHAWAEQHVAGAP